MNKKIVYLIMLLVSVNLFAEYVPMFLPSQSVYFFQKGKTIYLYEEGWRRMNEINIEKVQANTDGYLEALVFDTMRYVVYGGNHCYLFPVFEGTRRSMDEGETALLIPSVTFDSFKQKMTGVYEKEIGSVIFPLWNIKSITATSFLTEKSNGKEIQYTTYELNKLVTYDGMGCNWFSNHTPWVEGKEDAGIGESLTITFDSPEKSMLVLNGFVDLNRRHLYKANNRVKKAVIRAAEFEFEFEFEDVVKLSEIIFPKATERIEFIIKEVYQGNKWNDTVITAIMTNYEFSEDYIDYLKSRLTNMLKLKNGET